MYVVIIHVLMLVIISLIPIYFPRFVLTWFFPLHGMSFPQQFSIKPWKHNKNNETPMNEIHLLRNSVPERTCAHRLPISISLHLCFMYIHGRLIWILSIFPFSSLNILPVFTAYKVQPWNHEFMCEFLKKCSLIYSMDWFNEKAMENHRLSHYVWGNFPLNQSIDLMLGPG